MMEVICVEPYPDSREPTRLPGFERVDGEWRLRLDYYETFIEDLTAVEVDGDLSPQQLKTIQCRIEGCVESYNRDGDCLCGDLDKYEHVDSMDAIHELSRFFRVLVARRVEEPPSIPS